MNTRRRFLAAAAGGALVIPQVLSARATQEAAPATGKVPIIRLNNGVEMPQLGFGTYRVIEGAQKAVSTALRAGYRLVDTGAFYKNETQVGQGIAESGVPRPELFVTTKLWIADYGFDEALRSFDASAKRLGLEQVDLYMLHYPTPSNFEGTFAAWKAIERLLKEGRVRAIGVSNFGPRHLERLLERTEIVPAVNQIELHPYFTQPEVRAANVRHGVVTQSWSPLGGIFINHPKDPKAVTRLLDDARIAEIAARHGKSPAQIVLRWHLQHGVATIPKSVNPAHMAENIDVFGFELPETDMAALDALDTGMRGGTDPEIFDMDLMRARAKR